MRYIWGFLASLLFATLAWAGYDEGVEAFESGEV